ncbi:MAG: pyruvate dehydrogenase E1 component [Burkholderiaceae bacterium]|jgi:pyruvate dehydrogenase E1 component
MNDISRIHEHIRNTLASGRVDDDPEETQEWLSALESVVHHAGPERGLYLLQQLLMVAPQFGLVTRVPITTPYWNTIPMRSEPTYPGDLATEERISSIVRWNALAMVVRANRAYGELGGHIASYASAADLFEVGYNHFFRASDGDKASGDLVYFQAHSAPGVYARAFLEGRLPEDRVQNYRREVDNKGLCSYPHPWLMPDFWQFPTGSMGLGPINSIYQARFLRYLENRGLLAQSDRHVWGVFGDGEMDEPESMAALGLAAREKLDNLTFIINCNLQRLDGPVRGNGQIIQELEALFRGAGWNVIKVMWGSDWDALFERDHDGILLKYLHETVDGEYQTLAASDGRANREHFFSKHPDLQTIVAHLSDDQIDQLRRGGHDPVKIYAAYAAALAHKGQPTAILAMTKKGYGMGSWGQGKMTTHQQKKLDEDALMAFRDRFKLPLSDDDVREVRFYKPAGDTREMQYMHAHRAALGGYLPTRNRDAPIIPVPPLSDFAQFALQANDKEMSTTMAFVRMLGNLLKDREFGPRIVPIVADEARTFGMANLFRQIGIYSWQGQLYEPEDAGSMLYYKESTDGQILEEGISEAGAVSSWIAAGTSYSTHGVPMLPMYIYYSMFGFQRIGDLIWAAADQRTRGFLIGATAGRTTLAGEGLQHQDGTSQLIAASVPNCRAYDPAFAGELAVILREGMRCMLEDQQDVFYYLTVMNENYAQPSLPEGIDEAVIKGMYRFMSVEPSAARGQVRLLGSGAILREAIKAAGMLADDWNVAVEVWSVTSFSELEREAREAARQDVHRPHHIAHESYVGQCLAGDAPIVAATDYVRAYPQLIAPYVDAPYYVLGTDGFGRSDTRTALRRFFEIDSAYICMTALHALVRQGRLNKSMVAEALHRYQIDEDKMNPSWI